jgi:hypothetical protein
MREGLILAIVIGLGAAVPAQTQQASGAGPNRGVGSSTPGASAGTTGTTYATPGAESKQAVPGGGIPMGAATQDSSNLPADPSNFGNGSSSNRR